MHLVASVYSHIPDVDGLIFRYFFSEKRLRRKPSLMDSAIPPAIPWRTRYDFAMPYLVFVNEKS